MWGGRGVRGVRCEVGVRTDKINSVIREERGDRRREQRSERSEKSKKSEARGARRERGKERGEERGERRARREFVTCGYSGWPPCPGTRRLHIPHLPYHHHRNK